MTIVNVFISAVTTDTLSRKEAVAWVNNLLKSHFTKVEEMASGAAYCQLTHLLFESAINLRKVKFNPRNEPDVLNNWKVLTVSWKNLGIDKPVDVEKMKKGKFQDNMEFLQWFYKFFNANVSTDPEEYDAVSARLGEDLPALKGSTGPRPAAAPVRPVAARPVPVRAAVAPSVKATPPPVAAVPAAARNGARPAPATSAGVRSPANEAMIKENEELKQEVEELKQVAEEWKKMAEEMESEREFYFTMLQKVEKLAHEAVELKATTIELATLTSVLYEGNEDAAVEADEESTANGNSTLDRAIIEPLQANLDDTETF